MESLSICIFIAIVIFYHYRNVRDRIPGQEKRRDFLPTDIVPAPQKSRHRTFSKDFGQDVISEQPLGRNRKSTENRFSIPVWIGQPFGGLSCLALGLAAR